ncbi:MAG: transglutaminase domain-containing protein [Acidimicrobiia bacterium]|nr:transglutaminase domain-containing protein [Acidimicrobiia bacterium]
MVFRLTWLASFSLLALVILRLTRLFLPTEEGLPWPIVVIIAAMLGAVITWATGKARFGPVAMVIGHVVLFGLFAFIYVGGELADATIPPLDVMGDILSEVSDALTVFRFSAPPVTALAGIVALAAMMVWALSAVATWGLLNNSPYLGIVPPVVFYLQLAVIDRQSTSMLWTTTLLLLVGAGLAAIASDQRSGGGHAGHGRQAARMRAIAVPVLAIVSVTAISVLVTRQAVRADAVPATGILDWRNRSGIGGGVGSVSYNPFIDVQRSLVSNSDTPVFAAFVAGNVPTNEVYWRLLTMDSFNGDWWYASADDLENLDKTSWEADEYEFRGATIPVTQEVTILNLSSAWLPAAYSPTALASEERLIKNTTRVDSIDGSLRIDGVTGRGMVYLVQSEIPSVDARVLAADKSGEGLSPLFEAAAREGRFQSLPAPADVADEPRDLDRYLRLPRDLEDVAAMERLANEITFGLETDYEKALALEHFFRNPDEFTYSINVDPNERNSGLGDWLLNPNSPGYRIGYCEQFSASMGVLSRLLGIPTRTVLGFTPGEKRVDGSILVRDRNAHAWVEVWLPAQGWVRFDPTPRSDGVNPTTFRATGLTAGDLNRYFSTIEAEARLAAEGGGGGGDIPFRDPNLDPDRFAGEGGGGGETTVGGFSIPGWLIPAALWTLLGAVVLGIVPSIKRRRRWRRLRRLENGDVGAAWAEIVDRLTDAGFSPSAAATPLEVATATDVAMEPLAIVYSASVYGPEGVIGEGSHQEAITSLTATEQGLRSRATRWQRLRRTYRVRSLLPDWIRRARRR